MDEGDGKRTVEIASTLPVDGHGSISALLQAPAGAEAVYVFAHGAGAGMAHVFMRDFATRLAMRGIATLRYQFPFMERGSRRVDPPATAHAAVRAAVHAAATRHPGLPLFAGGKSFGGRMTSQAQAIAPMADVKGLVFVGFPLHPESKPSTTRADHLASIDIPMLFLQGTRDALAEMPLIETVTAALGARATLQPIDGADHAFHVTRASGTDDCRVHDAMADTIVDWIRTR